MMGVSSGKIVRIEMKDEVTIRLFVEEGPKITDELTDLANSMAESNDKIKVDIEYVDRGRNELLKQYHIEHWPCIVLEKDGVSRIRYYGVPSGYELVAMKDAIHELSTSSPRLSHMSLESLSKIRRKANVKVFVLTTCPFCPSVVRHAYRAAIVSEKVTTEIIDFSMFQDLALRHSVMGVPKMILNNNTDVTGVVDEVDFFKRLRDADMSLLGGMYQ
ncbi:MAG: thioredoxin family protein [Thermoplasmata archaeon]|nr:thioredoxin family protein [Thermoplasmata archaeon]